MKGAQADMDTVAGFQKRLQSLCEEAADRGVVPTVECIPLLPLAMGNYAMQPLARPQWFNSDNMMGDKKVPVAA